jgi:multidrug efflux pump subunit AcrA (membrane-fusion protein)
MIRAATRPYRHIPGATLLCAALLLVSACEQKKAPSSPPPPKVTVSQPVRQDITDYLDLTGNTQSVNSVQLVARVEGYLEKVFFQDGDFVKKGQVLFRIQQNTYIARLQEAEGNVLTQKALLEHAKIEYARYSNLLKQKAAAQTDVENWRYQVDSAQAALMVAEAQRDLAKLELGYTTVTAPFSGRIDRRLVDPGNLVGAGSNTATNSTNNNTSAAGATGANSGSSSILAQMTQLDPIYVYFNVSETDVSTLAGSVRPASGNGTGGRSPVLAGLVNEEGYPHEGYLDFTATSVSPTTGTLLIRGVFPNSGGKMLPGQYARVRVPIGKERSAILVPKAAIGFDQLGSYAMVVNDNDTVERRTVKTGAPRENMYVIENGLTGDERVIVNGLVRAAPGRQVTPVQETPQQQPADAGPAENPDKG